MPLNHYVTLGHSGLRVSPFALGAMTFGSDLGWGSSVQDSELILRRYLEAGGNFVDTANVYTKGHSERIIGDFFKRELDERAADLEAASAERDSLALELIESAAGLDAARGERDALTLTLKTERAARAANIVTIESSPDRDRSLACRCVKSYSRGIGCDDTSRAPRPRSSVRRSRPPLQGPGVAPMRHHRRIQ